MSKTHRNEEVYIVDAARTIIGVPYKSLKEHTAVDLGAAVIKGLIKRNKLKKKVDEVILGNTVAAGVGQNPARQAALAAGVAPAVNAYTVNNVCGASLQSVILGAHSIALKEADCVIAGGSESASHVPLLIREENEADRIDALVYDGLSCQISNKRMGEIMERCARKHKISREEQDQYSYLTHKKAVAAQEKNVFEDEIIVIDKKKIKDDGPRKNVRLGDIKRLLPSFEKGGSVTAANSSSPCDGAAVVVLASKSMIKRTRLKPMARVLGQASVSTKPELTFESTHLAIKEALKKCKLETKDVDLFEVAEAFAAQLLIVQKKMSLPEEKLNIYGGDVAFGHPLGAAGARILTTLVHALKREKKKTGLAAISYGGGGSLCLIVESL